MGDGYPNSILRVTYLELLEAPPLPTRRAGPERISLERLTRVAYLGLYRHVGESLCWDQRLLIPEADLEALLSGRCLKIYVVRNVCGDALGFC
jgi:hypothetical protein